MSISNSRIPMYLCMHIHITICMHIHIPISSVYTCDLWRFVRYIPAVGQYSLNVYHYYRNGRLTGSSMKTIYRCDLYPTD